MVYLLFFKSIAKKLSLSILVFNLLSFYIIVNDLVSYLNGKLIKNKQNKIIKELANLTKAYSTLYNSPLANLAKG
jgi:hypothetical protein